MALIRRPAGRFCFSLRERGQGLSKEKKGNRLYGHRLLVPAKAAPGATVAGRGMLGQETQHRPPPTCDLPSADCCPSSGKSTDLANSPVTTAYGPAIHAVPGMSAVAG